MCFLCLERFLAFKEKRPVRHIVFPAISRFVGRWIKKKVILLQRTMRSLEKAGRFHPRSADRTVILVGPGFTKTGKNRGPPTSKPCKKWGGFFCLHFGCYGSVTPYINTYLCIREKERGIKKRWLLFLILPFVSRH